MNNNLISLNISTLKLRYLEIGQGLFTKKAIYCTMNISQIIKDRRLLLGLTQQDLADYTELSLRIINIQHPQQDCGNIGIRDYHASIRF